MYLNLRKLCVLYLSTQAQSEFSVLELLPLLFDDGDGLFLWFVFFATTFILYKNQTALLFSETW